MERGSPPRKKGRLLTKTKYFFQPTNKLVHEGAHSRQDGVVEVVDIEDEDDVDEGGENAVFDAEQQHGGEYGQSKFKGSEISIQNRNEVEPMHTHTEDKDTASGSAVTPTKFDYEKLIREHHSSDDSFDGIRWGGSPQKKTTGTIVGGSLAATRQNNRSSPLKNVTSPIANGDQVNSVLNKYGTGFNNILSQTPTLKKTHSDLSIRNDKRQQLEVSPTFNMMRSKTLGYDDMKEFNKPDRALETLQRHDSLKLKPTAAVNCVSVGANSSALNNWLTKFEDPSSSKQHSQQQPTQEAVNDIDFEDDFSDSMLEPESDTHAKLPVSDPFVEKSEPPTSIKIKVEVDDLEFSDFSDEEEIPNTGDNPPPKNLQTNVLDLSDDLDSDPFSDNDPPVESTAHLDSIKIKGAISDDDEDPFSDEDIPTTQQLKDKKHAELFQRDVKRFDLQNTDSTQEKFEPQNNAKISFQRLDLRRYQIKQVLRNQYKIQERVRRQIILSVISGDDKELKLIVRGEYVELDFEIGDVIHIILTGSNHTLIDDQNNLLIWNPDVLVSATNVSQQMSCPRKTVLLNRFRYPGESSIPLVVGTILHVIFQSCLVNETWTDEFIKETLERELDEHLLEIFSIGNELDKVRAEIEEHFAYIKSWFQLFFKKTLSSKNVIPTNQRNQKCQFTVSNVLDVEENIWSPMFGIKGMVDVTLEANVQRYNNPDNSGKFLIPMEIKTGREHLSHHAQSSLYALLFKDRYDINVNSFVLLYTKEKNMKLNDLSQTDLKSLVNLRNRLTKYLKEDCVEYPELLQLSVCDRCEIQKSCMTINKLLENGTLEQSGLPDGVYDSYTSHLDNSPHYKQFYEYWDELLTKEESVISSLKKDLWIYTAQEREARGGKALANMIITEAKDDDDDRNFTYTFERDPMSSISETLQISQLSKNERVIISDESGHFAIAQGYINTIRPNFIVVASNRRIMNTDIHSSSFNKDNNQTFQSVLHKTQSQSSLQKKVFRIDRDEMFHGLGLARYNILNLFMEGGDVRRRDIIVDLKPPTFRNSSPLFHSLQSVLEKESFNPDQCEAFKKVISTEEYCLILGMPGTGKTTVIAKLIEFLVSTGNSVLLASYTHSAVDNILMKVKSLGVKGILRVGHPGRVHKDIQEYLVQSSNISTYKDFAAKYMEPLVVATTCLGIGDIAFNLRDHFDYCIIDEASQVSMPISLGPLRFCDKFVLVGDHYQLPPLVQHPSKRVKQGLSYSMFKMLGDKHPESVVELTYQYRMCEEVMLLSNLLVYDGRLKCGSEEVAKQQLSIPHPENISRFTSNEYTGDLWMNRLLDPENKVLFLNHDNLPGLERVVGEKVENPTEVELIYQIIESFTNCGVDENSIGVMSLYRAQLRLLNRKLVHKANVEVLTADQFQGRDKDCIIISLVRSNKENRVGDLLKEWRRVNVAITRSKSKLIVIGSKSTLKNIATLNAFMGLIESRGWMYDLEKGALDLYKFMFEEQKSPKRVLKPQVKHNISEKLMKTHPLVRDIVNEHK